MKYITFPAENLEQIPQEALDELHLSPRYSVDGTEIIMKVVNYEKLFPSVQILPLTDDLKPQEIIYPYPTYEGSSLQELLLTNKWSEQLNTDNNETL